ncbi:hypothetical protein NC652_041132 [Populus alba x Populus x berolinensis]|nr:hypothetical protein NC652_041132 [Populus alba x Populus x berolinensis]
MTNEPWNLLPLSIKGRVDEWVKDLVLENKHNLKQLIVLMWDQLIRSRKNLIFPAAAAAAAEYYLPKLRHCHNSEGSSLSFWLKADQQEPKKETANPITYCLAFTSCS